MRRWTGIYLCMAAVASGCAEPAEERESRNKEVVRSFVAAINARNFAALDALVAPNVVRHSPSTPGVSVRSRDDLKAFFRQDLAGVPDAVQEIRMMVAEGDRVALWANYSGTQDGPLGPFPPSGRTVDLDFAAMLRLEEGRIAEMWVVWDNLSMLTELGHLTPPGAGSAVGGTAGGPERDIESLRELGAGYTAAWNSRDPARVAAFYRENGSLTVNDAEPAVGREAIAAVARGFMTAFPDMVLAMDSLVATEGRVRYHWTFAGTHTGPGGTGNAVRFSGYEEWTMGEDGLIAASLGHFDEAEYERQLEAGVSGRPR